MAKNYKNPARYRLDFIKENTFNRVWSVRRTRTRVALVTAAVTAGGAALIFFIIAYTPLRRMLPDSLSGDLRNRYLETALRLDSLEQKARLNDAYIANLASILSDELPEDSAMYRAAEKVMLDDSLLQASETERSFLRRFEEDARFNVSVLSPIAAEGMVFNSPVSAGTDISDMPGGRPGVRITSHGAAPVTAVYRGTVLGVYTRPDGSCAVIIQHPNDFISIYDGLGDVFVDKGLKVSAGQRIAHMSPTLATTFELWHKGTPLAPREYMNF